MNLKKVQKNEKVNKFSKSFAKIQYTNTNNVVIFTLVKFGFCTIIEAQLRAIFLRRKNGSAASS